MPNVFVQRNLINSALVTRVIGLACFCILGAFGLFAQPVTTEAVNLGTWTAVATSSAAGNDDEWYGVTYGNGRFVAVGDGMFGDAIMTSTDGLTWATTSAAGDDDTWYGVTYGNGLFVVVGTGDGVSDVDVVMTSTDGLTWATTSAAGDDDSWYSLTYGNGQFVAVGGLSGDIVMYSYDGLAWTTASAAGDDDLWNSVTYGNGRFVAVGISGNDLAMYSDDGQNWTPSAAVSDTDTWRSVTYGNGRFVAVGYNNNLVMTSADGQNWIPVSAAGNDDQWYDVTYSNGLFVAGGYAGDDRVMYSTDGLTWATTSAAGDDDSWKAFAYGNGRFVAVGSFGDRIMTAASDPWSLSQTGFQFRNDNGSEITATSIKGQNSNLEFPANVPVRLRTQIDSQLATTTIPYYLQYKNTGSESDWHTVGVDDPYPTIRSVWSGRDGSSVTSRTLQHTPCLIGDLNLVVFSHDGIQTSRSTSTGWHKLGEASNGITVTGAIYYKFADGNDSLVIATQGSEEASYVSYCIAGAGTPSGTVADGSGANSNPPRHDTGAIRNHLFMVTRSGDNTVVATAAPSGYGGFLTQAALTSAGASTNVAYQYVTASTTDPGIFTSGTPEQWVSWTIAIPPRQTPTVGTLEAAISKTPATSTNNAGYGSIAWTNAGRATSSDESRASLTVSSTTASNYMNVTEWGFAIPSNATITGITASVEKTQSGGGSGAARDNSIRLIKGGTVVGNNYASTTLDWQTTESIFTYGTSSGMWGTTWTPADINATNFGIAIAVAGSAVGANRVANIDHVSLNVYYTVPAPIGLALSSNIASGGASTTAKMIAPTIHVKADFSGGHITEDQAPTPAVQISHSSYTELEWSLIATGTASTSDTFEFRTSIGLGAPVESIAGNILFTIAPTTTTAFITVSGTAYSDIGSTTVPAGQEVVIALGEANPILYSTTTASGGVFTINVATSTGSTFVPVTTEKSNDTIVSVAYGKGLYVAITPGNTILTSRNGVKWTKRQGISSTAVWKDITYAKGLFVAVGAVGAESGDSIMFSNDGIEWQSANPNFSLQQSWTSVTYGKGRFVAVADDFDKVAYSSNAIDWTLVSGAAGDDDAWNSVTFGNGQFIAVASSGNSRVMTSSDGLSWSAQSAAGDDDSWTGITYGKGRFVATGNGGNNRAMYSSDGISWTAVSALGDDDGWKSVKYGNGRYLAIGKGGDNRAMTSLDGIIWSILTTKRNNHNWNKVTYGKGKFIIAGDPVGGENVTTLDPGIGPDTPVVVYRKATSSLGSTFIAGLDGLSTLSGIPLYGNTMLVYNATTSATTSVTDLGELTFYDSTNDSNIVYNALSATSTTIFADLITATGTTKASSYLSLGGDFTQNGSFDSNDGTIEFTGANPVISGTLGTTSPFSSVVSSPRTNALSWLGVDAPYHHNTITYGNGLFASPGFEGVMISTNGTTWSTTSVSGNGYWTSITYANNRFVAVGQGSSRVMYSDDGFSWTAVATSSASDNNDSWTSVTYGNGRFVAVGASGDRVMYSDDNGQTWTTVATTSAAGNNDLWEGVTYGNGRFVAVGTGSDRLMTSTDGLNWATTSVAGDNDNWRAITYGNSRFVAVSSSGDRTMTSTDGLTWATSSVSTGNFRGVTYGDGKFVVIGRYNIPIVSEDGLNWITGGNDVNAYWEDVTYGNGRFVAVAALNQTAMVSVNGATSFNTDVQVLGDLNVVGATYFNAPTTTLTIAGNLNQDGYFNPRSGTVYLTGIDKTISGDLYNPDQLDFSLYTGQTTVSGSYYYPSPTATMYSLTIDEGATFTAPYASLTLYGNYENKGTTINAATTTFVGTSPFIAGNATGTNSFQSIVSNPKLEFASVSAAGDNDTWESVTYGNGRFVAVGRAGDRVMTSTDGLTWTAVATSSASGNDDQWTDVTYANGLFVAVGWWGPDYVMTSSDGINWITRSAAGNNDSWWGVTYANGLFVAVGWGPDYVMTSPDGINWTPQSAAGNNDQWEDITYGNGRFVAVGRTTGDRIMTSTDGFSWAAVATSSAAGNNDDWSSVTYGNGRFVAVGTAGDLVITSADGLIWATTSAAGNDDSWSSVTFDNGRFVAVGGSGDLVMTSIDGLTWATSSTVFANTAGRGITYGNGRFVAVGSGDSVMTALGNGADLQMAAPVTLTGSLIIDSATNLLAPTSTMSIAGNFENRGTFHPRAGTTTLTGVGFNITGPLTSLDTNTNSPDYGLTNIAGSYTYIGNGTTSALTIDAGGELTAPAGGILAVSHNFTNNGTFINNGATTTFSGNLSGTTTGTSTLGNTVINSRSQGLEWQAIATSSAAGNDDQWFVVTYGNGRFVAVGDGASADGVMTSTDGLTWATTSAVGNNDTWWAVTYGNGRFVAVGSGPGTDRVMTSTDGLTWATTSAAGDNDGWTTVTYGNGRFVAVGLGPGTDRVMTSTDGLTWATTSAAGNDDEWSSITYGNGRFVAVGYSTSGDNLMTSTDGLTWATTSAAGNDDEWSSITYGNGRFVAVGYSTSGDNLMTSTDGLTWVATTEADANSEWYGVTYGNGRFVTVGAFNIMTSTDGLTWASYQKNSRLYSVSYGNNLFVALGENAVDISSGVSLFNDNASTSNLTINASSILNASGTTVSITGNYTNNGALTAASSTFIFNGVSTQVATGTMTATSSFNNLIIVNTSGSGSSSQSVQFGAAVSASGTMTMLASTSARFVATTTNTFNNVSWVGGTTSPVWLRSSVPGTTWNLDISGTQDVSFVNVRDSDATLTAPGVTNAGGTDSGNNTNWNFGTFVPTWNDTDWVLYDTITIQQENIDADLTDFPVYINMADLSTQFWNTVSSSTGDIRIMTDDLLTELPREIVFASTTAETGELHFKANFVSSTTDTVFRIYYNGVAADYAGNATYGAENVWRDYLAVLHLDEAVNNTADGYRDSTGNGYDGTGNSMALTAPAGRLSGSAQSFDGSVDYILLNTGVIAATKENTSVSTWFRTDSAPSANGEAMYSERAATGNDIFKLDYGNSAGPNEPSLTWRNDGGTLVSVLQSEVVSYTDNNWHYNVITVNGSNATLFINGTQEGTNTLLAKSFTDSGLESRLGGDQGDANSDWNGELDEFRISSTTRSASWIRAEYINQSTSTDFYTAAGNYTAIVTLGNHPLGQVNNTFSGSNKTDEPLFAFTLEPSIDAASTTITLTLSNTIGLSATNLSDWRLYRDSNADQVIDGGDVQVGGVGTFSTTSVIFATPFLVSASHSYIVTADLTDIEQGDRVSISLTDATINATSTESGLALPVVGAVSSTNHLRSKKAAGTGSVNFINIGAPGNGIQSGGGNQGGEELGGLPNFNPPAANGSPHNQWTSGANGYLSDGAYTTETTAGERQSYGTYGFNIPTNNEITGIEVKLEASASTPAGTIEVALSWDNGTSITTTRTTATLSTTDTIYTLGTPSDLWGRAWVPSEFTNGTFGVRIIGQPTGGNTVQVDAMQVRVYHQAGGGGAGVDGGEL